MDVKCIELNLTGSGFVFLLDLTPENELVLYSQLQWSDGIFDVAFAEDHPDVLISASGDGAVQLWNVTNPQVL